MVGRQNIDLLVIAGDLLARDWEDGQRKQAAPIISALKRAGVPCFYLMGNDRSAEAIRKIRRKPLKCFRSPQAEEPHGPQMRCFDPLLS